MPAVEGNPSIELLCAVGYRVVADADTAYQPVIKLSALPLFDEVNDQCVLGTFENGQLVGFSNIEDIGVNLYAVTRFVDGVDGDDRSYINYMAELQDMFYIPAEYEGAPAVSAPVMPYPFAEALSVDLLPKQIGTNEFGYSISNYAAKVHSAEGNPVPCAFLEGNIQNVNASLSPSGCLILKTDGSLGVTITESAGVISSYQVTDNMIPGYLDPESSETLEIDEEVILALPAINATETLIGKPTTWVVPLD